MTISKKEETMHNPDVSRISSIYSFTDCQSSSKNAIPTFESPVAHFSDQVLILDLQPNATLVSVLAWANNTVRLRNSFDRLVTVNLRANAMRSYIAKLRAYFIFLGTGYEGDWKNILRNIFAFGSLMWPSSCVFANSKKYQSTTSGCEGYYSKAQHFDMLFRHVQTLEHPSLSRVREVPCPKVGGSYYKSAGRSQWKQACI